MMATSREEAARYNSPLNNPCLQETALTRKCLEENDYKHDMCDMYFENYKQCKKFWGRVRKTRRSQGLSDYPPPEEREKVKQEYLKKVFS